MAVLGLPWEYTAADVCELIEAAAIADGDQPGEAGVEAVEVAYRDDGKSEVRMIMLRDMACCCMSYLFAEGRGCVSCLCYLCAGPCSSHGDCWLASSYPQHKSVACTGIAQLC